MSPLSHEFQVFVKPAGARCNLACSYCYYLEKEGLYPEAKVPRMPPDLLEQYIRQHIEASPGEEIRFSWHGGEPTLLGLDYFSDLVRLEKKHCPPDKKIVNGIQTNGTLLNESWCRFFKREGFVVGISIDGPQELHDRYRLTRNGKSVFDRVLRGWELLQKHRIPGEVLCVVNDRNVRHPKELYGFFRKIGARYITFLPLVERIQSDKMNGDPVKSVSPRSVPSGAWGEFLCAVFDEWMEKDIGEVEVQIFNEAAVTAFGQEHTLCIFKRICGGVPVVEHNGDFYSCDHFVDPEHLLGNIRNTPLITLLESPDQQAFGRAKRDTLPDYCLSCEVRDMCNGECPKNRFLQTPDGDPGLNYLCAGYKRFFTHCRPFVDALSRLSEE